MHEHIQELQELLEERLEAESQKLEVHENHLRRLQERRQMIARGIVEDLLPNLEIGIVHRLEAMLPGFHVPTEEQHGFFVSLKSFFGSEPQEEVDHSVTLEGLRGQLQHYLDTTPDLNLDLWGEVTSLDRQIEEVQTGPMSQSAQEVQAINERLSALSRGKKLNHDRMKPEHQERFRSGLGQQIHQVRAGQPIYTSRSIVEEHHDDSTSSPLDYWVLDQMTSPSQNLFEDDSTPQFVAGGGTNDGGGGGDDSPSSGSSSDFSQDGPGSISDHESLGSGSYS